MARDAAFSDLVVDQAALAQAWYSLGPDLEPGRYHWRVAASDSELGDGPFGTPRSFRQPPPTPALEAVLVSPDRISVRWQGAPPSPGYRVQVARDPLFRDVWVDASADQPSLDSPQPAPGSYFVRVQAIGPDGVAGPFSPARSAEVRSRFSFWPLLLLLPFLLPW